MYVPTQEDPAVVDLRAADGRGALFWAYEFSRMDIVKLLLDNGATDDDVDVHGNTPRSLLGKSQPPRPAAPEPVEEEDDDEDDEEEERDL